MPPLFSPFFEEMKMTEDFGFDIEQEQTGDTMQRMRAMASEVIAQERLVEELEENLAEIKKQLNKLKMIELPDLMAECGMSELKTDDGVTIKIEDFVSGSLPKDFDKREAAISWLEDHDAAGLIKTELTLAFEKSQHNEAMSLAAELHERGYDSAAKMGVHPQTLIAHVKERLRKGEEVPLEVLGLYAGRTAKIKFPKVKT